MQWTKITSCKYYLWSKGRSIGWRVRWCVCVQCDCCNYLIWYDAKSTGYLLQNQPIDTVVVTKVVFYSSAHWIKSSWKIFFTCKLFTSITYFLGNHSFIIRDVTSIYTNNQKSASPSFQDSWSIINTLQASAILGTWRFALAWMKKSDSGRNTYTYCEAFW